MTVSTNLPLQDYIDAFAGNAASAISNVTFTGNPQQIGIFQINNNQPNINIPYGIVLSTGRVTDIPAPGTANFASFGFGGAGYPPLNSIAGATTNDAAVLSFNFQPQGDTMRFNFVFASEEYPNFAPPMSSSFNDAFGFFITGPGFAPNTNIALLPGTTQIVSINSVNPVTNPSFYAVNNGPGMAFNAYIVKITAIAAVDPCQTYTLRLAIADGGDNVYDSAVFLESFSFSGFTPFANSPYQDPNTGLPILFEGCSNPNYGFNIVRSGNVMNQDTVFLFYGGSATYGVDYLPLPDTLIFPPGLSDIFVPVNTLADAISEPIELIQIKIPAGFNCAGSSDTLLATLMLYDTSPLQSTIPDSVTVCEGEILTLTASASGGVPPSYLFQWQNMPPGITHDFTINQDTVIYLTISSDCALPITDSVVVKLLQLNGPAQAVIGPDTTVCFNTLGTLFASGLNGTGNYTYAWAQNGVPLLTTTPTLAIGPMAFSADYEVTVWDGCSQATASVQVTVLPPLQAAAGPAQTVCLGQAVQLEALAAGGNGGPYAYTWTLNGAPAGTGPSPTVTGLPSGTHTFVCTVSDGCTQPDAVVTTVVTVRPALALALAASPTAVCAGQASVLSASAQGGDGSHTVTWSGPGVAPGTTGPALAVQPGATATYTATLTDGCGTPAATASVQVTVVPAPTAQFTVTPPGPICEGGEVVLQHTGAAAGGTAFYVWDLPAGGQVVSGSVSGPGPIRVRFAQAGTYAFGLSVTVNNGAASCAASHGPVALVVTPQPTAGILAPPSQCHNGGQHQYTFVNTGSTGPGFSYLWDFGPHGQPQASAADTGRTRFGQPGAHTVRLTVTDPSGLCSAQAAATVVHWADAPTPATVGDTLCAGFATTLRVAPPLSGTLTYEWYRPSGAASPFHTGAAYATPRLEATTTYWVGARVTATGCPSLGRTPVTALVNGIPGLRVVDLNPGELQVPSAVASFGTNVPAGSQGYHFLWDLGDGSSSTLPRPTHQYTEPGDYAVTVTVTDSNGCTNSAGPVRARVTEKDYVQVPTAFSPNGSLENDALVVFPRLADDIRLWVYDRYGRVVYEGAGPGLRWDGTHQNGGSNPCPEGVYPYRLTYRAYNGQQREQTGTVTLIR
jgi:gliding motility-associated-like protein